MTTPLEQLRDELIGWFDVEFEPDAIDLVRRFYDYALSEHERAEKLAAEMNLLPGGSYLGVWEAFRRRGDYARGVERERDQARQVAAHLLRGVRKARRAVLGIHEDGSPSVNIDDVLDLVSAFHDWHARLSPALRKLVES